MSQKIQGVLLDVDGTLIDSNRAHTKAWVEAFAEFGMDIDSAKVREKIGMGGDHLVPEIAKLSKDSKVRKAIDIRRGEIFREKYLPNIRPFPSAQQLLEFLSAQGLILVAATSASEQDMHRILSQAGIEKSFDVLVSSEDAQNSKPNSDIIEAAILKSGLSKAGVCLIGDTPYDIEAAQTLHIPVIALTCGGWKDEDLSYAQAIFKDPKDLLEYLQKQEDAVLALHRILFNEKFQNPFQTRGKEPLTSNSPFRG